MTERLSKKLVREAKARPRQTVYDLRDSATDAVTEFHKPTISRALRRNELHGHGAQKRLYVKKNCLKAHSVVSRRSLNESPACWKWILWSCETKMELFDMNFKKHI